MFSVSTKVLKETEIQSCVCVCLVLQGGAQTRAFKTSYYRKVETKKMTSSRVNATFSKSASEPFVYTLAPHRVIHTCKNTHTHKDA